MLAMKRWHKVAYRNVLEFAGSRGHRGAGAYIRNIKEVVVPVA